MKNLCMYVYFMVYVITGDYDSDLDYLSPNNATANVDCVMNGVNIWTTCVQQTLV